MGAKIEEYRSLTGAIKQRVTLKVDGKKYSAKDEQKLAKKLRKKARHYRWGTKAVNVAAGASSLGGLFGAAVEMGAGESVGTFGTVFAVGEGVAGALLIVNAKAIRPRIERRAQRLEYAANVVYVDPRVTELRRLANRPTPK
jgi:hypothetical protein